MNDYETKRALDICSNDKACNFCPAKDTDNCIKVVMLSAFHLIERLQTTIGCYEWRYGDLLKKLNEAQAEIERYKSLYGDLKSENLETIGRIKAVKSETRKEFAERLKEKTWQGMWDVNAHIDIDDIDNLLEEMEKKDSDE